MINLSSYSQSLKAHTAALMIDLTLRSTFFISAPPFASFSITSKRISPMNHPNFISSSRYFSSHSLFSIFSLTFLWLATLSAQLLNFYFTGLRLAHFDLNCSLLHFS